MFEQKLEELSELRFRTDPHYRKWYLQVAAAGENTTVVGVHIPKLKELAKQVCQEEDIVHVIDLMCSSSTLSHEQRILLGLILDFAPLALEERLVCVRRFLPWINSWAITDTFAMASSWMGKAPCRQMWDFIVELSESDLYFNRRLSVVLAMCHFLDEKNFLRTIEFASRLSRVSRPPYYLEMALAWLMATALAKQPSLMRSALSRFSFSESVLRLYVRKCRESRITRYMDPFLEDEYLDEVDSNGEPVGRSVTRLEAHCVGVPHRTSHVWIMRRREGRSEVLLQMRSSKKAMCPSCYDISSAGHIPAGCSFVESALRELEEELSIKASASQLVYVTDRKFLTRFVSGRRRMVDDQFSRVFLLDLDVEPDALRLQESEVDHVRWFEIGECLQMVRSGSFAHCIDAGELESVAAAFASRHGL